MIQNQVGTGWSIQGGALAFLVLMCSVTSNWSQTSTSTPTLNCSDDTWAATSIINAPKARESHTAVWTGNEMIVWGGTSSDIGYGYPSYFNTGGRYNPSSDSWTPTSTMNAPSARTWHTGVWTGSEMIVWGGLLIGSAPPPRNTGGRYDPIADSWTVTSTSNAPVARYFPTAVWTGTEMIVWGGFAEGNGESNTGGKYNPATDTWTATSIVNAPTARYNHTAVWTGTEMIVWGGDSNTGGRYNPATDTWTATSTAKAPTARAGHSVIWTGNEMIVWGGVSVDNFGVLNTGARYNPATDTWTATSTANAPTARAGHSVIWTGNEMIVWGGDGIPEPGGRYNPITDSWRSTSTANAPAATRFGHTAVWTGTKMMVWGGLDLDPTDSRRGGFTINTGGRYCALPANLP